MRHECTIERVENILQVVIDGSSLTVEQAVAVARFGAKVILAEEAVARMEESRAMVEDIVDQGKIVYGISTGFGDFSKISIDADLLETLQTNLLLSHCVGVGQPFKEEIVRAMMLLRANALCIGCSGIRPMVVGALLAMLNKGVHPLVPEKGSLGASGDLAPLSHMALVLLGKGEAFYKGERLSGAEAMARAGIETFMLKAKEGLALINGTQAMTAVGVLSYYDARATAQLADIAAALTMEALFALEAAFDPRVQAVRPHKGQTLVARNIRGIIKGSGIIAQAKTMRVQDAYAIRCVPQVHGAVRDALERVRETLEIEMNAVTDNPILFVEDGAVISGGNFHGEPLALVFDYMGIAMAEIGSIAERRIERLVNPALSSGLPAFLTRNGGLNSGYMIVQYSAAALVSENKVLAHPASVDSIPSSANQEDHVSMGTIAARKSADIVENSRTVVAFELLLAAQGLDLRGGKPSPINKAVYDIIRSEVPFLEEDREIRLDIERIRELAKTGRLNRCVLDTFAEFE